MTVLSLQPTNGFLAPTGGRQDHFPVNAECLYGTYILVWPAQTEQPVCGQVAGRQNRASGEYPRSPSWVGQNLRANPFVCVNWCGRVCLGGNSGYTVPSNAAKPH